MYHQYKYCVLQKDQSALRLVSYPHIMRIFLAFHSFCLILFLDDAIAFSNAGAWRKQPIAAAKNDHHPLQSCARTTTASTRRPAMPSTLIWGAFNGDTDSSESQSQSYVRKTWSDFLYGANFVHSRYLELFWEYNFKRTIIAWVMPVVALLVGTQLISPIVGSMTFDFLKYLCTAVFYAASALGGLLTLPFDALRWTITLTPAVVIPMFDYLPSKAAIQLVKILLDLHSAMNVLAQTTLLTGVAVVLWRPMIEEIQYRYLLSKLLGKGRKDQHASIKGDPYGTPVVHFIPVNEAGETTPDPATENVQSSSQSKSRRQFLSSIAFASTRLGWLCANPETVDPSLPFLQTAISPYSWTVAFMQSVMAHFSSRVLSELSPLLQRSLLLLAIQQAVSTFFVTWYVFLPLYEERGIAASVGAHMAWTFGKMTWPIRLLWRAMAGVSAAKCFVVPSSIQSLLDRKR